MHDRGVIGYTKHRGGGETRQGITYKTQRRWGYKTGDNIQNTKEVGIQGREGIQYRRQRRWGCGTKRQ